MKSLTCQPLRLRHAAAPTGAMAQRLNAPAGQPNQTNAEGDNVSLQVSATDPNVSPSYPNGYPLTYDAVSLPAGLTINHATGLIFGTVSYSAAEAFGGVYPVTVVVADAGGASASE